MFPYLLNYNLFPQMTAAYLWVLVTSPGRYPCVLFVAPNRKCSRVLKDTYHHQNIPLQIVVLIDSWNAPPNGEHVFLFNNS